jgi:hypothetical protein
MLRHKFPGKGADTPVATIKDIVAIVSKLKCDVGRRLAEYSAQLTSGLFGGDLRIANAALAAREEQERLAIEDPTNPARLFGEAVEADGGADDEHMVELDLRIQGRITWRDTRVKQSTIMTHRKETQRSLGAPLKYALETTGQLDKASLGYEDPSADAFKKRLKLQLARSIMDYSTEEQVSLNDFANTLVRTRLAKEAASNGMTMDKMKDIVDKSANEIHAIGESTGVHISETNPFVKENRRNRLEGEPPAPKAKVPRLSAQTQPVGTTTVIPYTPRPFDTWPLSGGRTWEKQAEIKAVQHMHSLGFDDARRNGDIYTPDGGVDIISSKAVGQVKCYINKNVEVSKLREFVGACHNGTVHHGKQLVVYATGVTKPALEFANETGMAVFAYDQHGVMLPKNAHAQRLIDGFNASQLACIASRRIKRGNTRV